MSKRKSYNVQGLLLSNVKEFCDYIFGQFYINAKISKHENIIELFLKKTINVKQENGTFKEEKIDEYVDMEHFNKRWKGKIKVFMHEEQQ